MPPHQDLTQWLRRRPVTALAIGGVLGVGVTVFARQLGHAVRHADELDPVNGVTLIAGLLLAITASTAVAIAEHQLPPFSFRARIFRMSLLFTGAAFTMPVFTASPASRWAPVVLAAPFIAAFVFRAWRAGRRVEAPPTFS